MRKQNRRRFGQLTSDSRYPKFLAAALDAHFQNAQLPTVEPDLMGGGGSLNNGWVYGVQKSEQNPHGVLRRANLASFLRGHAKWQRLLE